MDTRINKYNESDKMSRVSKNSDLYKQINDSELDNFNVHSNATVIGNQEREIDVEQIKKILDKRYNDRPQRRSIRVEPREEVSRLDKEDTKEYDLTKVLEKAKDEKVETYEEVRAKKLRNTQYDILNNLNIEEAEEKEEKKINPEENLMNLINTITINEAKKKEEEKDGDPLDILTDLKGDDDTQVYESMETSVTTITEIKEKEKEKENLNKENSKKETLDNSFYTSDLFKKKDFEDENDFVEDDKVGVGIKILIALVIIVFLVGLFLFNMKRFKKRKNLKISKVIYIVVALIFFFTYILFNLYSKVTSDKLIDVAFIKLNEFMEGFLSNNINFDLLKDDVMKDIIVINKNKEGEILYVTYDMDQAYYALEVVTQELETAISDLENGNKSVKSRNIVSGGKGIALRMPFFTGSSSVFLSNLGPSVYVPVNFVGSVLTNIKTKITDYGINNALVEIYVTIELKTDLISPVSEKTNKIEYNVLVASSVINGRVPEVYGGLIQNQSRNFSIPIE